ncbi:PIG-L deacetylase family protein [Actinoallomurus iriomotensis]|uniref:Acetylglucosaminylphosphatidylinositol deacetylase n=1 Tax=Actinoallomurus iriomotensis TaxID=478107 RepID=A0A9W6VZX5_9ACTN|nr:PIG-L family deacetylase [Actinoallomurus iriomotensis]GLY85794.1 acetylglucosaminylphosphatidylinositol deacetylase [Actinoallomurus iriomotensis]
MSADPIEPNPIDAPGTTEDEWRAWEGLAELPALDASAWRSVVVVAAHPDDEVLGVGGLMAMLADRGVRLRLVAVTDGEASHPAVAPEEIAARRIAESAAALAHIGACETVRLGLPDSGVDDEELRRLLPGLIDGFDACLTPWEYDVHADHEAVGRAALACGGQVWRFPIWTWHWARPGDPRLPWERAVQVPLPTLARERKRAAIDCFTSQFEGAEPILPPGVVAHFTRPWEVLFR